MNSVGVYHRERGGKHSHDPSKNARHISLNVVDFSSVLYLVFNRNPGEFSKRHANEKLDTQGISLSQK